MAENEPGQPLYFTDKEIDEINDVAGTIAEIFISSTEVKSTFLNNPLKFLRDKYRDFSIINLIKRSITLIKNFNRSIRNLFTKLKRVAGKCNVCVFAILVAIHAIAGKFLAIYTLMELTVERILPAIAKIFKVTNMNVNTFLEYLQFYTKKIKPVNLAFEFCKFTKRCSATDIIPGFKEIDLPDLDWALDLI